MQNPSQTLGVLGEELACHFLRAQGYQVFLKNFTCSLGEIDLIAKEGGVLAFVEVKTRRHEGMGHPAEAVTRFKRRQIVNTASWYLKRYGLRDLPCRFDVVSVLLPAGQEPRIELIRDAFGEKG